MTKRNLFDELMQGVEDLKLERTGKVTLKTAMLEDKPRPVITAKEIVQLRESLHVSRPVFARMIRTSHALWSDGNRIRVSLTRVALLC